MGIREDVADVLLADTDTFILIWDSESGWNSVGEGCDMYVRNALLQNGLKGLRSIVKDCDRELCELFLNRISKGMVGASPFVRVMEQRMNLQIRLMTCNDSFRYFNIECHFLKNSLQEIYKIVTEIKPLTQEEIYRLELARTITNDKNPAYFVSGAERLFEANPDKRFALIQFDVAKFKVINEQYGEEVGDELINFFIDGLNMLLDKNQLFARLTADVFMIMTPFDDNDDILRLIDTIDRNLTGYKGISYTLFFGVCEINDKKAPLRKFGDGAAFARQSIKGDALNHVGFYEADMRQRAKTKKYVEDHMNKALTNNEFTMYLQPKYSISQGKIIGAEALVRWIDPERGVVPPMDFIPLFEENGFVVRIDRYIWEEACKTIRGWIDNGITPVPISVNASRRHFRDGKFVQYLNQLVEKYDIDKNLIEVEITETIEEAYVHEGMVMLKENGYKLLMDDFGSGYSSLNTLKDTQFDVIKIDRMFLKNFIGSYRGQKIVEHTIRMTRDIGLDLVAEGVETKEQADFLSECGCDAAQGFYYARPMPVNEFNQLLVSN